VGRVTKAEEPAQQAEVVSDDPDHCAYGNESRFAMAVAGVANNSEVKGEDG